MMERYAHTPDRKNYVVDKRMSLALHRVCGEFCKTVFLVCS